MIGPMTQDDLPDVLAIEALSFPTPWSEVVFRDELAHPDSVVLVWRDAGRVVGTIVYRVVPGEAGVEIDLHQVAVHPDTRRAGLGRRLVEHLITDARARGATRVTLEVRRDNIAAHALYARLGFERLAVRRGYYADGEDALILARGL